MREVRRRPWHAAPQGRRLRHGARSLHDRARARVVGKALESSSQPLDTQARAFFEPRLGRDLSDVRIHTSDAAAKSAQAIGASAYTVGNHIVFAEQQYSPATTHGRRLLAHELAHVLQQEGGALPVVRRQQADAGVSGTTSDMDAGVATDAGAISGGSPTEIVFEGYTLADARASLRRVLEDVVTGAGEEGASGFVDRFRAQVEDDRFRLTPAYLSDVHGIPDWIAQLRDRLPIEERILAAMQAEWDDLRRQNDLFLRQYEVQARLTISAALARSTERVTAERLRYGLTEVRAPEVETVLDVYGAGAGTIPSEYAMSDNAGTRGLASAARELAGMLRNLRSLESRQFDISSSSASGPGADFNHLSRVLADPEFQRLGVELRTAQQAYNAARFLRTREYPLLASFAPDPIGFSVFQVQALERIGQGANQRVAEELYGETATKLRSIQQTHENLRTGGLQVWSLPNIIAITNAQLAVTPMQHKLVDDQIENLRSAQALVDIALTALAVGLSLIAAIPTGGASLAVSAVVTAGAVGAAGVGTALAVRHVREYEIQAAAHGTDFDKAQAISREDPSLFWLALDLIGAGLDIFAAGAAFRSLEAAARRAIQLRRAGAVGAHAAEAEAALRELAELAEAQHPSRGLGRRVTDDVIAQSHRAGHEVDAGLVRWEESVNQQTRGYIVDHPNVRATYADMDEQVRAILTHCSELCVIPTATRRDAARVRALIDRLQLNPEQLGGLREYLYVRRNNLSGALAELEALQSPEQLRQRLLRAYQRAEDVPSVMVPGTTTAQIRASPGTAVGGERLPRIEAGDPWLRATGGEAAVIPRQIANQLRGRTFNNWGEFQQAFWEAVGRDPVLSAEFSPANVRRMTGATGRVYAPIAPSTQRMTPGGPPGPQTSFNLHHITPLEAGGGLYDLDNIVIVGPRFHQSIHNP
ncbi:MAG TPA: DUF4157 domain-containing protein [Archangium sp.]|nr:DUF4157 domain-containing protein [Archangium sp.]